MNRFCQFAALAALAVSEAGITAAPATPTAPMAKQVTALQACRTKADAAERLACYDKAVDDLSAATASQDVVVVERSEVRKARKGLFGFSLPRIGFLSGREGNKEDEADAVRLETKIASSRSVGYGKWRFTLDDGAIWETTEANIGFDDPLPGRTVLLEKGSLGGYFAKVGKGRSVRAKRVN
jgi:hypothetical protein